MARAAASSLDKLTALGAETLARLVMDGMTRDPAFKRIVAAALAGAKGPQAVMVLIDKRLAGLERARGFVDWDKVKAFAADLDATVTTIVDQVGEADAALAMTALLRFLKTAYSVLERVDDGQGRVQAVYDTAVEAMGPLAARLSAEDRAALPGRITDALGSDPMTMLPGLIMAVGPHLDDATLTKWDAQFIVPARPAPKGRPIAFEAQMRDNRALTVRQTIALVRRDLDTLAALEATKPPHMRNSLGLARLFLEAGRPTEALTWVRNPSGPTLRYLREADLSDGVRPLDYGRLQRASLEADILDALDDRPAAQALRWSTFAETLDPDILRDHMKKLGEFEEFDALDRAFALVEAAPNIHTALSFLIAWPRLDKAATLVVKHRDTWVGTAYGLLVPAAEALEPTHPPAAALLYRRLLDAILAQGQSKAYAHAARYLTRLDQLAADLDGLALPGVPQHAAYRAGITKKHARKAAFWALVK